MLLFLSGGPFKPQRSNRVQSCLAQFGASGCSLQRETRLLPSCSLLSFVGCVLLSFSGCPFCALRVRPLRKGLPSCSVHTLMHKCKKVRFERFGSLTDQNGPPEREGSTANKTKNSWGKTRFQGFGPLTGQNGPAEREGSTANKTKNSWGKTRFQGFGPLTGQNGPAEREGSTANTPAKRTTRRQWVGLGVKVSTRGPIIN